ncbi:MAG TPA: hypothetical protein VKU01_28870 [Bryobacteraceae bacterium]|nr:hypothetical protein [Bryobacteraceae bacterium]
MSVACVLGATGLLCAADGSGNENNGGNFKFVGGMQAGQDPQNNTNSVITVTTTPTVIGALVRNINGQVQVNSLTDELSLKYFFVNRTCSGGSPRFQIQVSLTGKNNDPNAHNAFGYLGTLPFGGGCLANTWTFNDLAKTDDPVARWDLSQFDSSTPSPVATCGNAMTCTWSQVVTYFSQFPNHRVLQLVLADDSCSFAATSCGTAYYDVITMGDRTLDGAPNNGN